MSMQTDSKSTPDQSTTDRSSTPEKDIYERLTMFSIEHPEFFTGNARTPHATLALLVLSADNGLTKDRLNRLTGAYQTAQTDAIRKVLGDAELSGLVDKERFFKIISAKGGRNIALELCGKFIAEHRCGFFINAFDMGSELLREKPEALGTVKAAMERRFGKAFFASLDTTPKLRESRDRLVGAMALAGEIIDSGVNDEEEIPVL